MFIWYNHWQSFRCRSLPDMECDSGHTYTGWRSTEWAVWACTVPYTLRLWHEPRMWAYSRWQVSPCRGKNRYNYVVIYKQSSIFITVRIWYNIWLSISTISYLFHCQLLTHIYSSCNNWPSKIANSRHPTFAFVFLLCYYYTSFYHLLVDSFCPLQKIIWLSWWGC